MTSRSDVINSLCALFPEPAYLEIGVWNGDTFFAVRAARKVAVDPDFLFDVADAARAHPGCQFHAVGSDAYFATIAAPDDRFDIIFLDGLHTFEQTLRDFTSAIRFLAPGGVIVIDDVIPNTYDASIPDHDRAYRLKARLGTDELSWMGDVYKLVFFIESFFPTFTFRTTSDNHGQAVVWAAPHARTDFTRRTVKAIAELEFIDVIENRDIFRRRPHTEIVEEIRAGRIKPI